MLIDGEEVIFRKENHEYETILDLIDDGPDLFMLRMTNNHNPDEIMQLPLTKSDLISMMLDVGAFEYTTLPR